MTSTSAKTGLAIRRSHAMARFVIAGVVAIGGLLVAVTICGDGAVREPNRSEPESPAHAPPGAAMGRGREARADVASVRRQAEQFASRLGGVLRSFDGREPIPGCRYSVWGRASDAAMHLGATDEDGVWRIPAGESSPTWRLVFHLRPYCDLEYEVADTTDDARDRDLRLPAMGVCEVRLPPALAADPADWQCLVEPWDPRFPERNESVAELRVTVPSSSGSVVATLRSFRFERMASRDIAAYTAPAGTQLVLGPWSQGHALRCVLPRVAVPSVHVLEAKARAGLRLLLRDAEQAVVDEEGSVFVRSGGDASWRAFPMYGGIALVEAGKVTDASRLEIEFCARDGEFFRAVATCEEAGGMRTVEFVKGRGRAAITSAVEAAVPHRQGWLRADDGRWAQLSEVGAMATSARQILRSAGAMQIAVPDGSTGCVFLADGSVIAFVGDAVRRIASQPNTMARHVLPPHLVQQLAGAEAMIVCLEARIEGEAEWLAVESRRLLASDRAPPWVVRDTLGVEYRTRWQRLAERNGAWIAIDDGVHEPLGGLGIPAPGVR